MSQPVYCRPEAYRLFRQQLPTVGEGGSLFHAAFAIALHERPEADFAEAETIVENLADTVKRRARSQSMPALLAHLHDVLFDVYGLRGNVENYYDPANSYLPDVLRTRLGIPITLVLVYKRVAELVGLVVHGVNAPGHFIAEVVGLTNVKIVGPVEVEGDAQQSGESMYVDPFFGGSVLTLAEVGERIAQTTGRGLPEPLLLEQASSHQWLSRMLTNLQAAFSALGQERDVYAMQELQLLLRS